MRDPVFTGDYSFNTGKLKQFSILDYVLFAAILIISASIGFYHAWMDRKKNSITEFLLAGKNMNPFPVGLSLLASFMSAITLLGIPAEMYSYTTIYLWIGLGYFLVVAGATHIYIPVFYNLEVTSAYEYLEKRFSQGVRTAASCTFVLQMILYMAIVLYAPSLALNAVTGFTLWGSVVSVTLVCTVYTAFGGMKAVLWTDCFQALMMVAALVTVLIRAAVVVGGIGPVVESGSRTHRNLWTDFQVDPSVRHTVWSLVFGCYFTWVAIFGVNQAMVQRAVTCRTLRDAKIAMWTTFPGLCIIIYVSSFIGMFMGAFYENCDPIQANFVTDSNQMLPMFVMDILGDVMGLPGIFVAGLFSGALSTISSGLNSISTVILEDVIRVYFHKDLSESRARIISQILALIFGGICLGLTFVASQLGNVLQAALSLFGMIGGPLLGLFSLGMFFPWANRWGAYAGLFSSLLLMFWIGIGAAVVKPPQTKASTFLYNCNLTSFDNATVAHILANKTDPLPPNTDPPYPLYTLSYLWYSATAVLATIVIGLIVSFITGHRNPTDLDPRLICPLCDHIFPFYFLPECIKKPLRFGIIHKGKYSKRESVTTESEKPLATTTKNDVLKDGIQVTVSENGSNIPSCEYDEDGKVETPL